MEFLLRFFIDGSEFAPKEHTFKYTHAARMLVPRIGEHVWLYSDKKGDYGEARFRVVRVEYDTYLYGEEIGLVDVHVTRDDPDDVEEEDY